jgi:feruloyl esterase
VIGAPANDFTGVMTYLLSLAQKGAEMEPLVPSQIEALSKATLARCDAADGVTDGVIDDPLGCQFDPGELQCKGAPDGKCLSPSQVESVRKIYDDVRDTKTNTRLAPGFQGGTRRRGSSMALLDRTGAQR